MKAWENGSEWVVMISQCTVPEVDRYLWATHCFISLKYPSEEEKKCCLLNFFLFFQEEKGLGGNILFFFFIIVLIL